ncbi:hypothetical protein Droror1_Dr00018326 [Drosera rotundifolia]
MVVQAGLLLLLVLPSAEVAGSDSSCLGMAADELWRRLAMTGDGMKQDLAGGMSRGAAIVSARGRVQARLASPGHARSSGLARAQPQTLTGPWLLFLSSSHVQMAQGQTQHSHLRRMLEPKTKLPTKASTGANAPTSSDSIAGF